MNTITGVIEAVYKDERSTRFGVKEATTFLIDGERYGGGFKKYTLKEGDEVTLTHDGSKYKNIVDITLLGSSKSTVSKPLGSGKKGYRAAGDEGGFPLHPLAYERALDRRNALNAAINFMTIRDTTKVDHTVAEVLAVARLFEAYTTGDEEREEALKEIQAEAADKLN